MVRVTHYDLAVIGTGSGNSIVDDRFADQRVAILEENLFGGTCLNVGCIPTKMYVYPADLARLAGHGPALGVETAFRDADWPAIRDRVFGRIDPIAAAGERYRREAANVDVYDARARFVGERTIDTGTGETITADQVVIAAGGRVQLPAIPGLDTVPFHTSDTVMRLDRLPRRLGIIGGGYVAAEFAHVFSALGSQVTQLHRGPRLLSAHDEEIGRRFTELAGAQWDVRLNTMASAVKPAGDGIRVALSDGGELVVDVLLVATGRVPNSDRLGLETAGVEVAEDGIVVVDDHQRTTAPGVWALGDIANRFQLKHVANHEARVIQHNLLHRDDLRASDHRFVPSAVFSSPQVCSVGLTEAEARAQGLTPRVVRQDYADVAYGWAMEDTTHFVKLIGDARGEFVLGAHIVGPQASVLMQPLIQMMSLGEVVSAVARGQYWTHPSLSEVVENALLKLMDA